MYIVFILILFTFSKDAIITEAVYNIMYNNSYLNYENNSLQISEILKDEVLSNFRLKKSCENKNITFYKIEHVFSNFIIFFSLASKSLSFSKNYSLANELSDWNIIPINNSNYKIQNKNGCFIKIYENNILCANINFESASQFKFIKIYEEVKLNQSEKEIVEKEPIDVVIKYIDIADSNIKIKGMPKKLPEYDDEEMKYCIRSILKNIPWVRKIFIVMPNEKVKYLKDYNLIKDKIIYIRDIDIYGSNNYNWLAFKFRYWTMKKFGLSDNFIAMDYNNFIGLPLNKTNFFYVVNGTVTPAIVANRFIELKNYSNPKEIKNDLKKYAYRLSPRQTTLTFKESLFHTYLYISQLFNESRFAVGHTFNAIPLNIKELYEIYNIVNNSEYRFNTLFSFYIQETSIQFQGFVLSYYFLKYNKKVSNLPMKLINTKNPVLAHYNYSLFSLITEENTYEYIAFMKSKIVLEYLYTDPCQYEPKVINDTFYITAFNAVYTVDYEFRQYKEERKNYTKKLKEEIRKYEVEFECYYLTIFLIILGILIYWKITINQKEREKLKGYQLFNKREVY